MYQDGKDLTALIGSRICHDLISPLGAISNGLELLAMSGLQGSPELDLINQSIANANSKIRFFRVAYGLAAHGATLARGEIASILDDYFSGSRLSVVWEPMQELQRREVKLAFLAIQCLETALPCGGEIAISAQQSQWVLTARGDKFASDLTQWETLMGGDHAADLPAAHVHFALLAMLSQWRNPALKVVITPHEITVTF